MSRKRPIISEDNPVMNFISNTSIEEPDTQEPEPLPSGADEGAGEIPEGYRINPLFIEKKTKRVQLIMQPSLYAKLKREADEENTSFNNYIHDLLRSYINALEEGESEENV